MKEKRRERRTKSSTETKSQPIDQSTTEDQDMVPEETVLKPEVKESYELDGEESTKHEEVVATQAISKREVLPPWGSFEQSEWMYSIPVREEDVELWAEEWGDFLLEWGQRNSVHVVSLSTFLKEAPFKDMSRKIDAFRIIGDSLSKKQVADWLDRGRRQLRIYWRPLEEWADIIYDWSLRTGKTLLDLKSIIIQEVDEEFAKLPERDLKIILTMLVQKELAEWIDKKQFAIRILV